MVISLTHTFQNSYLDVNQITKKWESLRRCHRRHLNRKKKCLKSGSAADDVEPSSPDEEDEEVSVWDSMSFLEPFMKVSSTISNMVRK